MFFTEEINLDNPDELDVVLPPERNLTKPEPPPKSEATFLQYKNEPYFENYDINKNYIRPLAIGGRTPQAVEFSNQSYRHLHFLKQFGDALMQDGAIIQGCDIVIKNEQVTILAGKIYMQGLIRRLEETNLIINGVGEENICCFIEEEIVTEIEDPDLNDPDVASDNYNQPGVHEVKQTIKLGINVEEGAVLYRLVDGEVLKYAEKDNNGLTKINDLLATRTYDNSGNYRVSGLVMSDKEVYTNDDISIALTAGRCYVLGYGVYKPCDTTFLVPKSKTTRHVIGEQITVPSKAPYTFKVNNSPVESVSRFVVVVSITQNIVRGNFQGGSDDLPNTPVYSVDKVVQNKVEYILGKDFSVENDTIDWSLPGKEPIPGTTYTVTYKYSRVLRPDIDFKVEVDYEKNISTVTLKDIVPAPNLRASIDYYYYLARKDLVGIDKNGEIVLVSGTPSKIKHIAEPRVDDDNLLIIGSILVYPNQNKNEIVNSSIEVLTMERISKVVRRVEDLEYNQAIHDLDREAMENEPPTELRGVFTDAFRNFSKCDLNHTTVDTRTFSSAIDIANGELTLSAKSNITEINSDDTSSNASNGSGSSGSIAGGSAGIIGEVITAPFKKVKILEQKYATQSMPVNPYQVFEALVPVKVIPQSDNWIENSTIVINNEKVRTEDHRFRGGSETKTTTTEEKISEETIPFMRQRSLQLESSGFYSGTDNIRCLFDDIPVNLTPLSGFASGSKKGTVQSDSKGTVKAKFTIPQNVPCGTKTIKLIADGDPSKRTREGSCTYTAIGKRRLTKKTVLKETVNYNYIDPLAQSFQLDKDTVLIGVDLFFAAKDTSLVCTVQIRNMVNGYPGNVSYAEKVLKPQDIKVSRDGSLATHVEFESPIDCKENISYCVVVLTDSSVTSLWVAEGGKRDVATNTFLTTNPYAAGVLFSSSNAQTWTAHQEADMKFALYRADFTGKGSYVFKNIPIEKASSVIIAIDELRPASTSATWYYSKNSSNEWITFEPYEEIEFTDTVAESIAIKVEFTASSYKSPLVLGNGINIVNYLNKTSGSYITRNVYLAEGFNTIRVVLEVALVTQTDFDVYYAIDTAGIEWFKFNKDKAVITPVDNDFVRWEWYVQNFLPAGTKEANNFRLKIDLRSDNALKRPRVRKMRSILKTV